ncbi:MAG: hypothetical protein R3F20_10750 [Planctomycetota bacterium]
MLLVTIVGVAAGRRIGTRAAAFERARNDYERERRRLLGEIAAGAET